MPATALVRRWQIFPTADGHFRWSPAGEVPMPGIPQTLTSTSELPKLAEGDGGDRSDGAPKMFRIGSGRSVPVRESSFRKARSVLERDNAAAVDRECTSVIADGAGDNGYPMFRTGLGKLVQLKPSSITKAAAVLGDDGANGVATIMKDGGSTDGRPMFRTGSGKSVTVSQSSVKRASAVLEGDISEKGVVTFVKEGDSNVGFPMFRTGSGKSVIVSQSSVRRAAAVLEGDVSHKGFVNTAHCGSNKSDVPMFSTGSGKSVLVKPSSIKKAVSVLQDVDYMATDKASKLIDDHHHTFSNSLFQTGSGKAVNVSSSGLSRATTLLGLEGNDKFSTSKNFEHAINHSDKNISTNWDTRWGVHSGICGTHKMDPQDVQSVERNSAAFTEDLCTVGNQSYKDVVQNFMGSDVCASDAGQPSLKFSTAGGKSLSISSDALKRARSLLGGSGLEQLHNVAKANQPTFLVEDKKMFNEASFNKENISIACLHPNADIKSHQQKNLLPFPTSTNSLKSSVLSGTISKGALPDQTKSNHFHSDSYYNSRRNLSHVQEPSTECLNAAHAAFDSFEKLPDYQHSAGPLADITNVHTENAVTNGLGSAKKRLRTRCSVTPFKRPRTSRFITPVNNNLSLLATDSAKLSSSDKRCSRTRVSTHYPVKSFRKTLREFFGGPPIKDLLRPLPDKVKHINPGNAESYRFCDTGGSDGIGPENLQNMLIQSGASLSIATEEWVANHYKWIVWKLASLERCYPAKVSGKLLTTFNVLEELKYRYEREVNYGHRSAVKRILDGDSSPASMMVLCIASIYSCSGSEICKLNESTDVVETTNNFNCLDGVATNHATRIELTDGWYSLNAILDVVLTKQLVAGKLFVGQKLRLWGASLYGWLGPISPFEASRTVSLLIHINGTYRAHWSDQLGFCMHLAALHSGKNLGDPLAFSCIKSAGGKIPRTLVGIARIYPILYKERFSDGSSLVRSERMEMKMLQLYNQRRSNVVEEIVGEQLDVSSNADDNEEGAKIFKILETCAEPELLMADMSSEQLKSFSTYQLKLEAIRQSNMQNKIEKALKDAGLSSREVTPFMRVRVVGLTIKSSRRRGPRKEGIITIWDPTEKQKLDLLEGQIYSVFGLMPLNFGSDVLHLQARGSSTTWTPMPSLSEKFEPFFTPRKPVMLSNIGEVPLESEFDIAAVVVHVGEVYVSGCQRKQWIFLTDGSKWSSKLPSEEMYDCLLAVSFNSPQNDNESYGQLSQCFAETTVAFHNLIKRARDQMNRLWVAEATENSMYSVCHNLPKDCHLKGAADSAKQWSKVSSKIIQQLRDKVLCIVGNQ